MRAIDVPAHENRFVTSGVDSANKQFVFSPKTLSIPDSDDETFEVIECKPESGDDTFFYQDETPKERITIHFTAGYLKGDIAALTTPNNHVSVPYVIARNGNIYELFDPRLWSYHRGKGALGGNGTGSKASIGIELSNVGPLTLKGSELETSYAGDVYCTLDETEFYVETEEFRDHTYFATHTDAQYNSLLLLLKYLTATFDIPYAFLPEPDRYTTSEGAAVFNGINTHINSRTDGKWDIGPGFDWSRIADGAEALVTSVPSSPDAGDSDGSEIQRYTVQSGDSLSGLAQKFNITVDALKSANESKLKTWGTVQGFNAGEEIEIPN